MTLDERKRGLRAAVEAKLRGAVQRRLSITGDLAEFSITGDLAKFIHNTETLFLWQVINSLVDEAAVLNEFMQDIEAVGAKTVGKEWPDLLVTYNKARIAKGETKPTVRSPDDVKGE